MTHPVEIRRICLMAEVGDGQDDAARAALQTRCKDMLGRVLRSADADQVGTWRQDRGGRHLVLLPVGTPARSTVPLLIRGLLEHLGQDRPDPGTPALRPRVSLALGTVTQARGGYAGQAIVAVSRLLDSADLRAALSGTPDALFAVILSDELYTEAVAQGDGTMPADGFRRVAVDAPDNLWQGVGWVRAWTASSAAAQPGKKGRGSSILEGVLPGLAGGLSDAATIAHSSTSLSGAGAHGASAGAEHAADAAHLSAAHAHGAEHAHAVQDQYTIQEGPGYVQETVVHTGYEEGAGYNSADYNASSGADHHSSGDHSGGVV